MNTIRIASLLCLCLGACSGETRPAAAPPSDGDLQGPVPAVGPAPAATSPSDPNIPAPESKPPEQVPAPSTERERRVNEGNLIAAPTRRRGDELIPGAPVVPSAAERISTDDQDLLLVPHDRLRDFRIGAELRHAIASDPSLSFAAKRVEIHAVDGVVTLRGVVGTLAERVAIVNAARRIAGDENVGSWIEIKR